MDTIRFQNIRLYAYHGSHAAEKELGQEFSLDVELVYDLTEAAQNDDLDKTIDYGAVYKVLSKAFVENSHNLIEGAAWHVMRALFKAFPAEEIAITVRKPSAPIEGIFDHVEVELIRSREEVDID